MYQRPKSDFSDFSRDERSRDERRRGAVPVFVRQSFHLYMMEQLEGKKEQLAAYLKQRAIEKPKVCAKCKNGRIAASRGLGPLFTHAGWLCDTCGDEEIDSTAAKFIPERKMDAYARGF